LSPLRSLSPETLPLTTSALSLLEDVLLDKRLALY
jgi:hypothetical protein